MLGYVQHHARDTRAQISTDLELRELGVAKETNSLHFNFPNGTNASLENGYYTNRGVAFADLLTAIGSTTATVYVNSTVTLTAHAPVPSNVTIKDAGGYFALGNFNLTVSGIFEWSHRRAFDYTGTGVVIWGDKTQTIFPEWFGDIEYGGANCEIPIQRAFDSAAASSTLGKEMTVEFPLNELYNTGDTVTLASEYVNLNMNGAIIVAQDFNGPALDIAPGDDGIETSRSYGRKYVIGVQRASINWTNSNNKYDDVSWVVNSIGARIVNANQADIKINTCQNFDVGVEIVCYKSCTFNNFWFYACRRNQIGIRVTTPDFGSDIGFFNDNILYNGDFRMDAGISSCNNKSRYWLVIDDVKDFDNNIFIKPSCELNTINYTMPSGTEGPCIWMSGFVFGNEFLHVRGESANGFARIERGTQSGEKYPAYNKFTAGAGFEEAYTAIEDNTPTQLSFVQNYRSAGEIASRFNVPLMVPEQLYDLAVTFVLNASLGTNDAGVQGYFIGTASSAPTYPAGAGHHEHATGVKADATTRSIILQPDRAIGKTIDGLFGGEEFLVMVKCAPSTDCRVAVRVYDSSGNPITSAGSVLGEPFRLVEYSSGVLSWRHGSDANDPSVRFKLNNSSIVAMDVLVFGGASNGYIQSIAVNGTQRQGVRHNSRPLKPWRVTADLLGYANMLLTSASGLVRQGPGAVFASIAHYISDTLTGLTGTDQTGLHVSPTFSSGAVTTGRAIRGQARTAAASYTMGRAVAVGAIDANVGAGSAITDNIGFECPDMTAGTNNYCWSSGQGLAKYGDRVLFAASANVASANDVTIGRGNLVTFTGSTQINRILTTGWQIGASIEAIMPAGIVVAHNTAAGSGYAGIWLQGLANWTVGASGGMIRLTYDGTYWRESSARVNY